MPLMSASVATLIVVAVRPGSLPPAVAFAHDPAEFETVPPPDEPPPVVPDDPPMLPVDPVEPPVEPVAPPPVEPTVPPPPVVSPPVVVVEPPPPRVNAATASSRSCFVSREPHAVDTSASTANTASAIRRIWAPLVPLMRQDIMSLFQDLFS